ncbi:CobW family GTP-binding protein [Paenibacillus sp. GCM10027627]|uniref:CobW family GTP-binding protein n=1 Tax=unclassified Paenibacillus TaxID=185978 RepID=UPI0036440AA3
MNNETERLTPVYLLSGFLGSGKTTLLARLLEHYKHQGLKPAVVMNELGEVNLDGELVDAAIPMAEMLGGCICCSIRSDLGVELGALIEQHRPDVIFIESTGAANPMETLDGITDAAMYKTVELRAVLTVVDGPELLQRSRNGKGRTFKLMKEQIRCGSHLLLNKADKLAPDELVEAQQLLRELNAYAPIMPTVRCEVQDWSWLSSAANAPIGAISPLNGVAEGETEQEEHHHSHEHVMVVTHYFRSSVSSGLFEELLTRLPDTIYRAKGIVSFSDTASGSRFLFQYAYKESDFIRIEPQGKVNDVAVFIGEHFSKDWLKNELAKLEA